MFQSARRPIDWVDADASAARGESLLIPRKTAAETLQVFVCQQDAATLASVQLELTEGHVDVRDRLVRLQRANEPKALVILC